MLPVLPFYTKCRREMQRSRFTSPVSVAQVSVGVIIEVSCFFTPRRKR